LTATACGSNRGGGPGTGAETGVAAVERFLGAAKARDTRGMSAVWGTAEGPMQGRVNDEETEKRMIVLQCFLTHDQARVTGELAAVGGGRQVTVELRQRELVRPTRFTAVSGPGARWYVESFDIEAVRDLCRPPERSR
jgi:hypothetical protein